MEAQLVAVREQAEVKEKELRHTVEVLRQEKKVLEDRVVAQDAQAVQEGDQLVQKVHIHCRSHAAVTLQSTLLACHPGSVWAPRLDASLTQPATSIASSVGSCFSGCRESAASRHRCISLKSVAPPDSHCTSGEGGRVGGLEA